MWRDKKGNAMIVVLCVLSVVIILGLSMAAISSNSRAATIKNQHNQQAYYTARSVLDGVVTMLTEKGAAENIASGLDTELGNPKQLIAEGSLQGMGSYRVTLALTAPVEYIIVQEPDLDSEGEQKTDEDGQLLYHEKRAVSRLPLKITVTSKYKDSAAMVSAYLHGTLRAGPGRRRRQQSGQNQRRCRSPSAEPVSAHYWRVRNHWQYG